MADAAALAQFFASFTKLDDDDVKLIGYTIVYLRRGEEHIVEGGSGEALIVESMTETDLIAFLIADWAKKSLADEEKKRAGKPPLDAKYLDVDFKVVHRWPRRELPFEDRQIDHLDLIAKAIEKRKGAPVLQIAPRELQ